MTRFLLAALALLLGLLPTVARAIDDPDTLAIPGVTGYADVLPDQAGDLLLVVQYNIAYAVLPEEQTSQTFLCRFFDAGGVERQAVAPFPFNDLGYNKGICSFYFTADQVTALGLAFESAGYTIRLQGNPAAFPSPPTKDSTVINWRTGNTRTVLGNDVLAIFQELQLANNWNVSLVEGSGAERKLTQIAATYAINAVPNLQLMTTQIFSISQSSPGFERRDFQKTYVSDLAAQLDGTFIGDGLEALANLTTLDRAVSDTLVAVGFALLAAGAVVWALIAAGVPQEPATAYGSATIGLTLPTLAYAGVGSLLFAGAVASIAVLIIVFVLFIGRS